MTIQKVYKARLSVYQLSITMPRNGLSKIKIEKHHTMRLASEWGLLIVAFGFWINKEIYKVMRYIYLAHSESVSGLSIKRWISGSQLKSRFLCGIKQALIGD